MAQAGGAMTEEEDRALEQFKIKRLVRSLETARGCVVRVQVVPKFLTCSVVTELA